MNIWLIKVFNPANQRFLSLLSFETQDKIMYITVFLKLDFRNGVNFQSFKRNRGKIFILSKIFYIVQFCLSVFIFFNVQSISALFHNFVFTVSILKFLQIFFQRQVKFWGPPGITLWQCFRKNRFKSDLKLFLYKYYKAKTLIDGCEIGRNCFRTIAYS